MSFCPFYTADCPPSEAALAVGAVCNIWSDKLHQHVAEEVGGVGEGGGTICLSQPQVSIQGQQPHMLRCIPVTVIPALRLFALFSTERLWKVVQT